MNDQSTLTHPRRARAIPNGDTDGQRFRPRDQALHGVLAENGSGSRLMAALLLSTAIDDTPEVMRRNIFDDTARWAALSLSGAPVMGTLLGVLCDAVFELAPFWSITDPEVCALTEGVALHSGVTDQHLAALMRYARERANVGNSGIRSTEAWIVSAATLAAVWITACAEDGAAVDGLIDARVRNCRPAAHLAHLHGNAATAMVDSLGLPAAWHE